jgi:hypothetical protein
MEALLTMQREKRQSALNGKLPGMISLIAVLN